MQHSVGVVVIGRNEGARLRKCLSSVLLCSNKVVYVDSGSSDGSVEFAESLGIDVVELNIKTAFSAGRARNEGFDNLVKKHPGVEFVQFVDGDCELVEGWIDAAARFLVRNVSYAIVAGRRKERFPEKSIYNRLCDIEWNTPIGEAEACGGDFMMRATAFQKVGGFNPTVIAGEEPEFCYRLKKHGWRVNRIDHLMTLHDAAMFRFSQWWMRTVRSGHAYAQGYALHGKEPLHYCLRDSARIWFWSLVVPFVIIFLAGHLRYELLLLFSIYLALLLKIFIKANRRLANWNQAILYGVFNLLGKWPQLIGQLLFLKRKILRENCAIVEYE